MRAAQDSLQGELLGHPTRSREAHEVAGSNCGRGRTPRAVVARGCPGGAPKDGRAAIAVTAGGSQR
eukprot:12832338-Alexandrium_andersonii.AAC.1